jgi:outer membrane lipoprotein-sorting protein
MKKIFTILFITFSVPFFAQITVDEILNKYLENSGGKENWEKINGVKFTGKANFGIEVPFETVQTKDGLTYTKINFQGKDIMQNVFDGTKLWSTNFMNQMPEEATAEQAQNFMKNDKQGFPSPFLNYNSKGFKVEYVGEETKEGTACYKVKLTQNPIMIDGVETPSIQFYYFDKENFMPIMSEMEVPAGPMKGQLALTSMSDYQEFGGLFFPMSLNMQGAALTFDKIEINPTIDSSIFVMPAK